VCVCVCVYVYGWKGGCESVRWVVVGLLVGCGWVKWAQSSCRSKIMVLLSLLILHVPVVQILNGASDQVFEMYITETIREELVCVCFRV
jgi:hypothetical protein